MQKIPHCDRCQDVSGDSCPDFAGDAQELWCPDGYKFVDDQLLKLPVRYETDHVPRLTRAQQLQIFMTHPIFTGLFPQCRYEYADDSDHLDWICPICGR